eukprot:4867105-Alexandrium_andersonii.AAC.1
MDPDTRALAMSLCGLPNLAQALKLAPTSTDPMPKVCLWLATRAKADSLKASLRALTKPFQ